MGTLNLDPHPSQEKNGILPGKPKGFPALGAPDIGLSLLQFLLIRLWWPAKGRNRHEARTLHPGRLLQPAEPMALDDEQ